MNVRKRRCRSLVVLLLLSPPGWAGETAANEFPVSFTPTERSRILAQGPWPQPVPADPGNEFSGLDWAEAAGARLFNETALSGNNQISCAGCHQRALAFTDARTVAQGEQRHVRNTQGLLDVGHQRWFGWDGGADSLWAASLRPMLSPVEMAGQIPRIARYLRSDKDMHAILRRSVPAASKPSDRKISSAEIRLSDQELVVTAAKFIGAYVRTLTSAKTAFDRYRDALQRDDPGGQAEYPERARRGLKIFVGDANCQVCHFGPNFSNGEFHDTGRPFFTGVGAVDPGRYTGLERVRKDPYNLSGRFNGTRAPKEIRKTVTVRKDQSNWGQWKTPTLRNLVLTGPYMHDGSIDTLRGVVDAYADIDPARLHANGEAILKPLALSNRDREDLVIFLQTLSP